MLTKGELKYFSSLLIKKFRKSENKFLVEGPKLVEEAVAANYSCEIILADKLFFDSNPGYFEQFRQRSIRIEIVKSAELEKVSDTKNPQGLVAVFEKKNPPDVKLDDEVIVALENISDPGNLGTIIRNCDWFGIESVLLSDDCAEIFSPKVIRSSAGSIFHLDVKEDHKFYMTIREMKKKGYVVLCADLSGRNIYDMKRPGKCIIVFANEANGPTQEILNLVDERITIPGKGKAESLNVASASAVILSELAK